MSAAPSSSGWWSRPALRCAVFFTPAILLCCAAGWFELGRARDGREIAWVYAAEWPMFAVVFGVMWWRTVAGRGTRRPSPPSSGDGIREDDPGLQAWRAYLDEART